MMGKRWLWMELAHPSKPRARLQVSDAVYAEERGAELTLLTRCVDSGGRLRTGFTRLSKDEVATLHHQLGLWLAENPGGRVGEPYTYEGDET